MIDSLEQIYTSIACNRLPEVVDWNSEGLVCYGATNSVAIWDTKIKGSDPLKIHNHHQAIVKSVKWVYDKENQTYEILSCSADNTGAIWSLVDGKWVVTSKLIGHKGAVTCIHGLYKENLTVYTASVDCTLKIWDRNEGTTKNTQTVSLNSGLCLTLHAFVLPSVEKPVLLCAMDDAKIHIYAGQPEYRKVHTLIGHEDWVRGIDVINIDEKSVMVASASQDTYIRLWKIQKHSDIQPTSGIEVEKKIFTEYDTEWSVELNAVLAGHESWVYGVQWLPTSKNMEPKNPMGYKLLSSSLDKTAIIWQPEQQGGVWVEKVRVGNVGGNGLGFYGSRFGPLGESFLAHGYNGSFHMWTLDKKTNNWKPCTVCGGHFGSVEDVRWEPVRGRYVVSVSSDQTTRIHAPWKRPDGGLEWHEIARPQVHGYDMTSIALVSSAEFASAADEKVIRTFKSPHGFLGNFRSIVGEELLEGGHSKVPEGASVPSLGLSNKAVYATDEDINGKKGGTGDYTPVLLTEPPTEECLMENTLWPETYKLYGHGYEVFALDASPDGSLLASSCKATNVEHAAVIIWTTEDWRQIQKLQSHNLTVTQLAFSPTSDFLLSVSRDRRWYLYRRVQGSNSFDIVAYTDKTNGIHTRIIWCCAWSHESEVFATGSRDGKVCLWSKTGSAAIKNSTGQYGLYGTPLELKNASVMAVAFAPLLLETSRVIAIGFETGNISIYSFCLNTGWTTLYEMDNSLAHHLTVKRLSFKPTKTKDDRILLASCGADHLVRIYGITLS